MPDIRARIRGLSPALAIIGIAAAAWFLDLHPATTPTKAPPAKASSSAPAARVQSGVVLLPGETLVTAPETAAAPAPAPSPEPRKQKAPTTPKYLKKPAPPVGAQLSPAPPPPRAPRNVTRDERNGTCVNCGRVVGMRIGDDWQVRVQFDDGSRQTLKFRDRPPVEIGDNVRLEDGVLVNARR